MLATISIEEWNIKEKIDKISRVDWADLHKRMPEIFDEWKEDAEKRPAIQSWRSTMIDLATDGFLLSKLDIPFQVKNFKGAYRVKAETVENVTYNLQVAVPNIGLLVINEVTVIEDACTNNLQSYLDDGWRIIAVCPPNGVRRPDYVLGRTK